MKFYCDSCQTKYSIADEKVRGKVLKVRCKNCSHIITVREPDAPAAAGGQSTRPKAKAKKRPATPKAPQAIQWHYSVNGQSFGPFEEKALQEKFASGELGDAVYVWNETFSAWKVVGEVEVFQKALKDGGKTRKPMSTVGVSGALEAIDREKVEAEAQEDKKKEEEEGKKEKEKGEERASQQERLEALRSRLKLDEDEDENEEKEKEKEKGEEKEKEALAEEKSAEEKVVSVERFELDLSELEDEEDDESEEGDEIEGFGDGSGVHDGLFSGMESSSFEAAQDQLEQREAQEDQVPFFGAAPKLGSDSGPGSMSRKDEISGSLLIQLNAIKSDGRKRAVVTVIAAILAVGVIGAVGYYGFTQRAEIEEDDRPRIRADHIGQAPQFRGYSEEERSRADLIIGQELVISREASRAAYEDSEERSGSGASARPRSEGSSAPARPQIDASAFRRIEADEEATRASDDDQAGAQGHFQRVGLAGIGSDDEGSSPRLGSLAGAAGDLDDDRLRAMAALQTDTQRGIYNPTGEVIEAPETRERLSNQDIAQGMQNVMASVGACRERHIMRGGTLEQDRVEVTLNILPTGRVGEFSLAPESLLDTDFGRCMTSHTRRWRFPPFQQGEPMQVRTPFLLQD